MCRVCGLTLDYHDRCRTNLSKHIANELRENYDQHIRVVKTSEVSLSGQSPVKYAPNSESTLAYQRLAKEVEQIGKNVTKNKLEFSR